MVIFPVLLRRLLRDIRRIGRFFFKLANVDVHILACIGILLAAPADHHSIHLIYSLDHLSFELVVDLLDELEFEMDDSILLNLKKTIYQFLDTNARDNMHIDVSQFEEESADSPDTPKIQHRSSEKYWEDYH